MYRAAYSTTANSSPVACFRYRGTSALGYFLRNDDLLERERCSIRRRSSVAGRLAGQTIQGTGFWATGDIIIGVAGAFVGGWLEVTTMMPRYFFAVLVGQKSEIEKCSRASRHRRAENEVEPARIVGNAVIAAFISADKANARETDRAKAES
jgi:hypothetical protein